MQRIMSEMYQSPSFFGTGDYMSYLLSEPVAKHKSIARYQKCVLVSVSLKCAGCKFR